MIKKKPTVKKPVKKKEVDLNHNWRRLKGTPPKKVALSPVTPIVDVNKVLEEISKDKACHVLCIYIDTVIFIKRIEITVSRTNNNPIFQPHDYLEKKVYCIMAIIEFNKSQNTGKGWPHVVDIKALGCPVVRIRDHGEIEMILKELN